jgi:D-sedoheptulose 7-phosphate isomerase
MEFTEKFIGQTLEIISKIDISLLDQIINEIAIIRENNGRLFFCGVGGSAGHASHAVNDFRKLVGIESYSPTDNVSEVTARTNDEGWETVFTEFLKVSKLNENDALFIMSVGGGSEDPPVSVNLVSAVKFAKSVGCKVLGIVGREEGYTKVNGDFVLVIPNMGNENLTPHTEGLTAVIWHLMVSHPKLKKNETKW